jgi:gas vesicle protein
MKEELEKKESSILVPFLVGGMVGAGIALLLAPKSGKEVRNDLKDYAARTRDTLTATIDESRKLYEEGKAAVTSAVEAGKTAFLQEKERYHKAA